VLSAARRASVCGEMRRDDAEELAWGFCGGAPHDGLVGGHDDAVTLLQGLM